MIKLIKIFIRIYQTLISPIIGSRCRYIPSCSEYTSKCLSVHGLKKGIYLSVKRVLSCHPWSDGGYDPVEPNVSLKNHFISKKIIE